MTQDDNDFIEESAGSIPEKITDQKWERVSSPDDPDRCQSATSRGQCMLKRVPGSQYCYAHGGAIAIKAQERRDLKNYKLTRYHVAVAEKSGSSGLKDLSEEVGILRVIMEERLNSIESTNDLLINTASIMQLATGIQKLVDSLHKIDKELNNLIDREQLLIIAEGIVQVITDAVEDPVKRRLVSEKVLDLILPSE